MKKLLLIICIICFSIQSHAQPTDFLTNIPTPVGIVKNGNTLYVGSLGDSKIVSVDLTNPSPQDFLTGISFPTKFIVIGSDLYLTYGVSSIGRIDLTSPTPAIVPIFTGLSFPYDLVQKDNFIYVSVRNLGEIVRFDYTSATPVLETVASGLGDFVGGIAFSGEELYIARGGDNFISKIDVSIPNPPIVDVISATSPFDVAIQNGYLYYAADYLNRINLSNTDIVSYTLLTNIDNIWDILFDGNDIYFAEQNDNSISSIGLDFFDNPTLSPDYTALQAFYNSTNGDNWTFNEGWLDTNVPLSEWVGVTTSNGRVTEIGLTNNNLTGSIPNEIGNLDQLTILGLQANNLSGELPESLWTLNLQALLLNNLGVVGSNNFTFTNTNNTTIGNLTNIQNFFLSNVPIPQEAADEIATLPNLDLLFCINCDLGPDLPVEWANLTALQLRGNNFTGNIPAVYQNRTDFLDIAENFYDFSDLEPLANNNSFPDPSQFIYSPQRTQDMPQTIEVAPGTNIQLDVNDTNLDRDANENLGSNQYQWFKNDIAISGANANTYTIFNAQIADSGIYYCAITNPLLPELSIEREDITVVVDDNLNTENFEKDSFGIFPNPAKDWLTIKMKQSQNASMKLFDVNGQLILEKELTTETTVLTIDQLSSGVYIISVSGNGINATKRFVKH
jgi:hypothetical protein